MDELSVWKCFDSNSASFIYFSERLDLRSFFLFFTALALVQRLFLPACKLPDFSS
jgi:hypothetical protein